MDFIRSSWKAIFAFGGSYVLTQLPALEVWVGNWAQSLIGAAFVAATVWLKANSGPQAS
jgi:hypothetical protein